MPAVEEEGSLDFVLLETGNVTILVASAILRFFYIIYTLFTSNYLCDISLILWVPVRSNMGPRLLVPVVLLLGRLLLSIIFSISWQDGQLTYES
jgi:preprotein translocase subunit SecY